MTSNNNGKRIEGLEINYKDNNNNNNDIGNDIVIKKSFFSKLNEKYQSKVEESIKKGYPKYHDTKLEGVDKFLSIRKNKEIDKKFLKDELKSLKKDDDFLFNYYYPILTRAEDKLLLLNDNLVLNNNKKTQIKRFIDYFILEKYFSFNKNEFNIIKNNDMTLLETMFLIKEYKEVFSKKNNNKLQSLKYLTNFYSFIYFSTYLLYRVLVKSLFLTFKENRPNSRFINTKFRMRLSKGFIKLPIYLCLIYCYAEAIRVKNSLIIIENRKRVVEIVNLNRGRIKNHKFAFNYNTGKIYGLKFSDFNE
jgi:hypothetical protein